MPGLQERSDAATFLQSWLYHVATPQRLCSPAQYVARPTSMLHSAECLRRFPWATMATFTPMAFIGPVLTGDGGSVRARRTGRSTRVYVRLLIRSLGRFFPAASDVESKFQFVGLTYEPYSCTRSIGCLCSRLAHCGPHPSHDQVLDLSSRCS